MGDFTRHLRRWVGVGAAMAVLLGVVACGSSSSNTSASGGGGSATSAGGGSTATSASGGSTATSSGTSTAAATSKPGHGELIGFINPVAAQPILAQFQEAFIAAGKTAGYHPVGLDSALSAQQELTNINQLTAQGVKAMLVFLLSNGSEQQSLGRAKSQGAKVIGFTEFPDRKVPANMGVYAADMEQGSPWEGAKLLADYVGKKLGGKGNVAGMGFCQSGGTIGMIIDNYKKYLLQDFPNIHWVATLCNPSDDVKGGQTATQQALTRYHNNINAVMAYNDTSAVGAGNAMRAAGIKNPVTVGENGGPDALAAIKNGTESASIDTEPVISAAMSIEMIENLFAGKAVAKPVVNPVTLITPQNVASHPSWASQMAQLKAGTLQVPPVQ